MRFGFRRSGGRIPRDIRPALDAFDEWAAAQGHRPATRRMRRTTIRALYAGAGLHRVEQLRQRHVTALLARPDLSASSRRTYAITMRAWLRWSGLRLEVPVPRVPKGTPRPARLAGIDAAMLAAPQPVRAWIALGRYAGLRAGEVARLRAEDVDLVGESMRVQGKGGQLAVVWVHPLLARELVAHVQRVGHGRLWDVNSQQVSRRAGVLLRTHTAADRFHQLRHYFGTEVYQQTGDIRKAQAALRHASSGTTEIYAQLLDDDLRAAVAMVR